MATEPTDIPPNNVPGKYWVDGSCLICDQCCTIAPEVFRHDPEHLRTVVHRQPDTPQLVAAAERALSMCPHESIRNNGDQRGAC